MKSHMTGVFFGVKSHPAFNQGLQNLINQVDPVGVFASDNLFTFNRNLGFLDDEIVMTAFNRHAETVAEQSTIWRTYTQCWAARRTMVIEGAGRADLSLQYPNPVRCTLLPRPNLRTHLVWAPERRGTPQVHILTELSSYAAVGSAILSSGVGIIWGGIESMRNGMGSIGTG